MKRRMFAWAVLLMTALSFSIEAGATRFKGMGVVDKETLVVRFQDGDIRYRDDATGKSASGLFIRNPAVAAVTVPAGGGPR